jgi:heme o synthase
MLALFGSLFLAIGGSTVLNMVYDRDIDLKMKRACRRPLPSGLVSVREALVLGSILAGLGVVWAFILNPLFGLVTFAGLFFDMLVYTIWLKRRTSWSIVWGGIAGAMPILAGRVLGTGHFDLVGLLLALAVLFWIPTHIVTFSLRYAEDYRRAGVPVFPNTHGERAARLIISISTVAAIMAMASAVWLIGFHWGYLQAVLGLSTVLLALAILSMLRKSSAMSFVLFKSASVYMLACSFVIVVGT